MDNNEHNLHSSLIYSRGIRQSSANIRRDSFNDLVLDSGILSGGGGGPPGTS